MSKQKRNKVNPQLQKQHEAEEKKKFNQKVKWFFSICGYEEVFKLVPLKILNVLFRLHYHAPYTYCSGHFPSGIHNEKELNYFVHEVMKFYNIEIPNTSNEISFYDYFTIGMTCIVGIIDSKGFVKSDLIREQVKDLYDKFFTIEKVQEQLYMLCRLLCYHFSALNTGIYYFIFQAKHAERTGDYDNPFRIIFDLEEAYRSSPLEIEIDHRARPIFKVGWLNKEKQFIQRCISPADLGLSTRRYTKPIPVYIQNHAINRLYERFGMVSQGFVHWQINVLLDKPKIIQLHDKSYLIEFRYNNLKAGYLQADLINKRLVIRTFLLAIHSVSPEAIRFHRLTGLSRNDMDFLKMKRLCDFAGTNIDNNPRIKSIFVKAGLMPMLECASFYYHRKEGATSFVEALNQYLNVEEEKPDWHQIAESIVIDDKPSYRSVSVR